MAITLYNNFELTFQAFAYNSDLKDYVSTSIREKNIVIWQEVTPCKNKLEAEIYANLFVEEIKIRAKTIIQDM